MNTRARPLVWDRSTNTARRFGPGALDFARLVIELARDAWRFGSWTGRLALLLAAFFFAVGATAVVAGAVVASFAVACGSR